MNDISNVQNNMDVKVEYYYLLLQKNLKLWYFHGFNHQKPNRICPNKEMNNDISNVYTKHVIEWKFFFP